LMDSVKRRAPPTWKGVAGLCLQLLWAAKSVAARRSKQKFPNGLPNALRRFSLVRSSSTAECPAVTFSAIQSFSG
jgi:hypothetical protein